MCGAYCVVQCYLSRREILEYTANISRYLPRKFAQYLLYKRDFWLYPLCHALEGLSICSRVYFILWLCLNVCNGGSLGQLMNGRSARQGRAKGLRRRAPRSQMKKSKAAQQKGVRRGCDWWHSTRAYNECIRRPHSSALVLCVVLIHSSSSFTTARNDYAQ